MAVRDQSQTTGFEPSADDVEPITRNVEYDDINKMERLIRRGWTYVGNQQWTPGHHPHDVLPMVRPTTFLPRLASDRIEGPELILTYPRLTDLKALIENEHDAAVRDHAIFAPLTKIAIDTMITDAYPGWRLGDSTVLIARQEFDGEPLVKVSIRSLVPPGVLDVGYATMPRHRGKGHATRALTMFTDWAFRTGRIQRIELGIKPGNTASARTAQRAGYRLETVRHSRLKNSDDSFDDEHSYVAISTDTARVWRSLP